MTYLVEKTKQIAIGFFCLSFFLLASVIMLYVQISAARTRIRDMPDVFKTDTARMLWTQIFFVCTYIMRAVSDYFVIPQLEKYREVCTINGTETVCLKSWFLLYYLWTNIIFDFFPLTLIIWFHHRHFRQDRRGGSLVQSTTEQETLSPGAQQDFPFKRESAGENSLFDTVILDDTGAVLPANHARATRTHSSGLNDSLVARHG